MKDLYIQHKIVILIPFRNANKYIVECINSIIIQQYSPYEVYLLDDASDDMLDEQIKKLVETTSNFHYSRNNNRIGALANIYQGLTKISINENDIVAIVDGDDQLFGEHSLSIINFTYNNSSAYLTYGQFIDSYGNTSNISPYTKDEFKKLRLAPWKATHLKTFKYSLFKRLLGIDPAVSILKIDDTNFYPSTYDMAIMFPLMEIAGFEKCICISNVLYCYRLHSQNDHATSEGRKLQIESEEHIRSRCPIKA
ncbi:glycosyl transferase family 2 [Chryseobacterium sp. CBTAP 102]|uniref:glycosyltransferase family 2 protein n=1 Tax=unclassified Chryseobacterium TaxID=2593645 RepID=UPI0009544540|nr:MULTISPECIES: glycosyltransferase family 2 protein [unclassified Chryseobacterium]PXW13723.1 glycosyl transferase family 2 [Chryseobacterium sp. CBTAP 102]SIQ56906.1 Glycosyl transferase family 2 [Chryseobacterium sp. RU33C]